MKTLEILSVNISEKKGVIKKPVDSIILNETGIEGDAHAGYWHRQVSLLAQESIEKAEITAGAKFPPGTFAENLTSRGIELHKTALFDKFICNEIELEVTQIGKKCHNTCAIGKQIGNCIMPLEGIFCRVIRGGEVKPGMVFQYIPRIIKIKIITLSDRAFKGIYKDESGPNVKKLLSEHLEKVNRHFHIEIDIVPDDKIILENEIKTAVENDADIIITTGGTGIGARDITPETVKPLLTKETPGIMELIRVKYGTINPNAALSRSIAGVIGNTLVYCLPGSVKATTEYISEIAPTLEHSFRMIYGIDNH
jgi:molybdopterin adenylyltransferase